MPWRSLWVIESLMALMDVTILKFVHRLLVLFRIGVRYIDGKKSYVTMKKENVERLNNSHEWSSRWLWD